MTKLNKKLIINNEYNEIGIKTNTNEMDTQKEVKKTLLIIDEDSESDDEEMSNEVLGQNSL